MEFINRENELFLLGETLERSLHSSQMTVIIGRRRIGKTSLAIKAFENNLFLYFFISRKNEALLCQDFLDEIGNKLNLPALGEYTSFTRLFELLLVTSQNRPFTLIIDEFQEFLHINTSIFSDMQNLWDRYKATAKLNLVISGSVYSLMKKIFENSREPLFGRANERIYLKPFNVSILKNLVAGANNAFKPEDLLAFYTITGGVAKYVEHFADKQKISLQRMLDEIFRENSLLLDEGMNLLIEEFGREYTTYFSILSLIASSKTSRSEIESILGKNTGGYLEKLENDYRIIQKVKPVLSKPGGKIQKYFIDDNFLGFWFRFIYKNKAALEIGNYSYARSIVERDFESFSGPYLEKYFRDKLALTGDYSLIGRYWEKGNQNEIDIVAVNANEKTVLFAEVKRKKTKISPSLLKAKSANLLNSFPGYKITYAHLSMEDM
ncbi:MAG: ATP-binding protein [Bacteroidetes bacterium]|nr:ATP-binding protein [Bacteroidota bacterium]